MASVGRLNLLNQALTATKVGSSVGLENAMVDLIGIIKTTNTNGATTVAGKIEQSFNGEDWQDYVTFANIVGTDSFEMVFPTTVAASQLRANVTLSGATQASTVLVAVQYRKD